MVYFVGAGTGAVDLITVRGQRLLKQADVIIYAGSLVNPELLQEAKKGCEIYNSAHMTLSEVIDKIRIAEENELTTVRLHTGEPSIYGAVREQMDALDKLSIPYESCPGVSACFGAAASLNLEYTLPGISQSLIITRMEGRTGVPDLEQIESLAAHQTSMAIYLSAGMLTELSRRLIAGGYRKDTPAALVYKATWPEEEAYSCTVGTLPYTAAEHGITKTAVVLVGDVLTHQNYRKSRLYAPDFATGFRPVRKGHASENVRLSIISFTEKGKRLSRRIAALYREADCILYTKSTAFQKQDEPFPVYAVEESVSMWAKMQMQQKRVLLFIGACGIAIRAVAPYLKDKLQDSPVLAADEQGNHVIPLLSGHMGGANELAVAIAEKIHAKPVITTATDLNGTFAVDLFAKKHTLYIANKDGIARVSAKILAGKTVTLSVESGHLKKSSEQMEQSLSQKGLCLIQYPPKDETDIIITSRPLPKDVMKQTTLLLRPKEYVLGIGCKKGKSTEEIAAFIRKFLKETGISKHQIYALASIELKKHEPGILKWAQTERIPFLTYSAKELKAAHGAFGTSEFVEKTTGVDNVCERAAVTACGERGRIVFPKVCFDGMTIAAAKRDWSVDFDEL